jgi:hypothetical protein
MVLGDQLYVGRVTGDEQRYKVSVTLTAGEFALLNDSAPIISSGLGYAYGPLDKTRLEMEPHLQGWLTWIVYMLRTRVQPIGVGDELLALEDTIARLTEISGPEYWLSGSHLRPEKGREFITRLIAAGSTFHQLGSARRELGNATFGTASITYGNIDFALFGLPYYLIHQASQPEGDAQLAFPSSGDNETVQRFNVALEACNLGKTSKPQDMLVPCLEAWDLAVQIRAEMDAKATPKADGRR